MQAWSAAFTWSGTDLAWAVIVYGFVASVLPVWLLLAPRDYLSAFLKIGTILVLGTAIVLLMPPMKLPAVTQFIDGTGPVFAGKLFPFAFITIACGAVSGFHALISSGTTPKLVKRESDIRVIGYGSMLMESLVGLMALIAAATLDPGVYFAMNVGPAILGTTPESASQAIAQWGFMLRPEQMTALAQQMGEASLLSRDFLEGRGIRDFLARLGAAGITARPGPDGFPALAFWLELPGADERSKLERILPRLAHDVAKYRRDRGLVPPFEVALEGDRWRVRLPEEAELKKGDAFAPVYAFRGDRWVLASCAAALDLPPPAAGTGHHVALTVDLGAAFAMLRARKVDVAAWERRLARLGRPRGDRRRPAALLVPAREAPGLDGSAEAVARSSA